MTAASLFGYQEPSQPTFTFPQSLTEKYRPQSLGDFAALPFRCFPSCILAKEYDVALL